MLPSSALSWWAVDQIVVSVGPYILRMSPLTTLRSSAASETGNASPPIRTVLTTRSASLASWSTINMPIIDGVHCRCVTFCDWIKAGSEYLPSRPSRHLVYVVRLELGDRLNTTQRCAKQAARFKIAIEREIEQRLHVGPGELAKI